jgi:hypothetical protein
MKRTKNFGFLCKSYREDIAAVVRLVSSFNKYNSEKIPLYLVVPRADVKLFQEKVPRFQGEILVEEDICQDLITKGLGNFSAGYINQQIVKLTFWKTNLLKNYLCLDSDCYFIKDFLRKDFMYDAHIPYTVIDKWQDYFLSEKEFVDWCDVYIKGIRKIQKCIGFDSRNLSSCTGMAIFNSKVLAHFEKNFLKKNRYSYNDILYMVPLEASWYSQWLLQNRLIEIIPTTGYFKIFGFSEQYYDARYLLLSQEDYSKMYFGLCLNSNWNNKSNYQNPSFLNVFFYKIRRIFFSMMHR